MADHFSIVSQRQTHEVVGGHELREVWEIGAQTIPHSIYFAFRLPLDAHTPEQVHERAEALALSLEQIRAHEGVTGIAYTQQIAGDGRLADEIEVYYAAPSGAHSGVLRYPLHPLYPETVSQHVSERCQHLGSIAGL